MLKENLTEEQKEYFRLGYLIALKNQMEGNVNPDALAAAEALDQPCPRNMVRDEYGNCVPRSPTG